MNEGEANSVISSVENVTNDLVAIAEIGEKKVVKKVDSKSYLDIAKDIIAVEGLGGLFGRGLQVRPAISL